MLVTPANRVALFLGRSLPVVVNGAIVSMFSLVVGGLLLGVRFPAASWLLALVVGIAAVSCTGLGLVNAALGLRVRETAVMSNVLFGLLLIFSGANIPVDALPGWMEACRAGCRSRTPSRPRARSPPGPRSRPSPAALIGRELLLGVAYGAVGLVALRLLEEEGRRRATLEIQ